MKWIDSYKSFILSEARNLPSTAEFSISNYSVIADQQQNIITIYTPFFLFQVSQVFSYKNSLNSTKQNFLLAGFFCLLDITLAVKEYVRRGWTAGFKAKKETLFYLLHRRNQGREPYNLTQTDIFSFLFVKIALIKFFQ